MREADRDLFRETGGACRAGKATCGQTACRHNLRSSIRDRRGDERGRRLHLPLWSCALAAADERPVTAEWVARCMGVTRARVAQIERQAISEVRSALEQLEP
jgi:hypothetical protein